MRKKFSSYGPVISKLHFHAPRKELINRAYTQLVGEVPEEGGHYITIWAPRQAGKTWVMQQVAQKIKKTGKFDMAILTMEFARDLQNPEQVIYVFLRELGNTLGREFPEIRSWEQLPDIFRNTCLEKPLILIMDEFDSLEETFINKFAGMFRSIYTDRRNEPEKETCEKTYLLHGLALIGVRSVLGIENKSGSPFNVQRSVRIPNLSYEEVDEMFGWYQEESGHKIEQDVVERLFYETRGQPGLTCWFGELLTEGFEDYEPDISRPTGAEDFEEVFEAAVNVLPNNNILNIISKARQVPYKEMVLDMFRTDEKIRFRYDNPDISFLYMNGVFDREKVGNIGNYVRFSSPFVQKRLFNCFSGDLFGYTGKLLEPFEDLSDTFTGDGLNIRGLMRRFENYLKKNREWLLKDAPVRKDLRIFEAVYHFILYQYLTSFLGMRHARVWPEFPTGNGKIDLIISYMGTTYALELKSYTDETGYSEALDKAAFYGKELELLEVSLVFFVEYISDENRKKYEKEYTDTETGVKVMPVFVSTGM
ncbi:MAG: hypothetical protein GY749_27615 [Desulfobacteraceae bacterium]|nr:hypothetical protein [Desulfobacteraceae bacterium]